MRAFGLSCSVGGDVVCVWDRARLSGFLPPLGMLCVFVWWGSCDICWFVVDDVVLAGHRARRLRYPARPLFFVKFVFIFGSNEGACNVASFSVYRAKLHPSLTLCSE